MAIQTIDFVNGLFSVIIVIIYVIVGLKIALKYKKYRQQSLVFVGTTWILMTEAWYSSGIAFLIVILTGRTPGLTAEQFFIIGTVFYPIASVSWIYAYVDMMKYSKTTKITLVGFFVIIGVVFDALIFYYVFTEPSVIGVLEGPCDATFNLWVNLYFIILIAMISATGFIFVVKSLKSGQPEIILKGKFLFIAFISFLVGASFDIIVDLMSGDIAIIILILGRMILVLSAITFYIGFVLPNIIKKMFLKNP